MIVFKKSLYVYIVYYSCSSCCHSNYIIKIGKKSYCGIYPFMSHSKRVLKYCYLLVVSNILVEDYHLLQYLLIL